MTPTLILSDEAEFAISWWKNRNQNVRYFGSEADFQILCGMFEVKPINEIETADHIENQYLCTYNGTEYFRVNYV